MTENVFQIMGTVLNNKKVPESEIEKIPSYVFCRWLSGNPNTILASNLINQYYDIPIVNQYYAIKNAFAGKIKFIKYPKSASEKFSKDLEIISKHYKVRPEIARQYAELISSDELNHLKSLYMDCK